MKQMLRLTQRNKPFMFILTMVVSLLMLPNLAGSVLAVRDMTVGATQVKEVIKTIDDAQVGTGYNQFHFVGTWNADAASADYEGTEHWTHKGIWGDTEPSFSIKFIGNKLEVYGKKDADLCIYKVVVDGNEATAFEADAFHASGAMNQQLLLTVADLAQAEHTVTVYAQNKRNTESTSSLNIGAQIDFAKVYSMEEVTDPDPDAMHETKIDDHDTGTNPFQFDFGAGWSTSEGFPQLFYKGTEHYAKASDSQKPSFKLNFYGSSINLYGKKESGGAQKVALSVDDGPVTEIDTNATTSSIQSLYKAEGLEEGLHVLHFNVLSNSGSVQVDYAVAEHKTIAVTGISVDKTSLTIEAGLSKKITAVAQPVYATQNTISYTSENTNIATVDSMGMVTAVAQGTTNIIATVEGTEFSKSVPVTVTAMGPALYVSVADETKLETQDDYAAIIESEKQSTFTATAWLGDIINSKINVATKNQAMTGVTITASDLTSGSAVIAASNVEATWLQETMANIGRGNGSAPVKPFSDIISTRNVVDIVAGKLQPAWVNINIPRDATPGVYTGTLTITAKEFTEKIELNYTIDVINLQLPTNEDVGSTIQIWQHPFAVASYYGVSADKYFTEDHLEYMRASMKEYAAMGGRDVVANIVEEAWNHQSYTSDPSMVQWTKKADGAFSFDYTLFDRWVEFNVAEGVLNPAKGIGQIKCYSIVPWNNQITYYDEASSKNISNSYTPGSDTWKSMWTTFLTDFIKHVESKGWFNITYIAMDERGLTELRPAVDLIETVKNDAGKSFKISSALNYQSPDDYSFTDRIYDVSINQGHVGSDFKNLTAHRAAKGLVTTIYTCTGDYPSSYIISDYGNNTWTMWYTLSQGATGFMRWAWDNWVADPLTNATYKWWEPGDGWFIYPVEKSGYTGSDYFYKTPRYEMLKQGVRDTNKAKYLLSLKDENADAVQALISTLKRPAPGGNGYGSATAANETQRLLALSEVVRMRTGVNEIASKLAGKNPELYTVTIGAMTNGVVTADKTTAAAGATVTLSVSPNSGYQLKAGTLKANDTPVTNNAFAMPAKNVTITAEFEKSSQQMQYTVTFDAKGGSEVAKKTTNTNGKLVTVPMSIRSGYTFDGWYLEEAMTTMVTANTVFTANTTVYAKWTKTSTGGGSSSGGSTNTGTTTTTTTNPDGSTTTTQKNNATGTVTTTTKHKDGHKTESITLKNGDKTTTETYVSGTKVVTTKTLEGGIQAIIHAAKQEKVVLPVGNATNTTVVLSVHADGKTDILARSYAENGDMVLEAEGTMNVRIENRTVSFADKTHAAWASDSIDFVASRGLFHGVSSTQFAPNTQMSRAMLFTVLARMEGQDVTGGDTWYGKAMNWAKENGISDGAKPDADISRQQLVTMLYRVVGSPSVTQDMSSTYTDAQMIASYAKSAMVWAVDAGILSGKTSTTLDPAGKATRAELATILQRFVMRQ